jgi:acyl transferase domain-containing protein
MSDQNNEKLLNQLKEAVVAIRKLKGELQKERAAKKEPIAIIGMAMRYPGDVNNADDYWNLLEKGIDGITAVPPGRYDVEALYDADPNAQGKIKVKEGGFIKDIEQFDISFFDISPVELENVDPQQRILLEVTHEAFENAGIDVAQLVGGNAGVYMGVATNDYQNKHFRSGDYKLLNPYSFTGQTFSAIAGRISYLMGFQGPCITIDTACSSSIVSAHLATKALRNHECDIAVTGAVNIVLEPEITIYFSNMNALSPEGRCKTFDNDANGFIRSEGCGVFILKRLSDAQRDGDNILALIKGSAVNSDGRSNGFTAPNVIAQEKLLKTALADADLSPEDIGFIEAHGTGTKIGDPIEVEAISKVYKPYKTKENPLLLGSVKTNLGHLEAAAGMAGMMKAVLALQHNQIPKNLHFKTPNELIHWDSLPLKVATTMQPFSGHIGVSGFGLTGTNGHIILGKAPEVEVQTEAISNPTDIYTLPISAKSKDALLAIAKVYATFIEAHKFPLEDICATAALRRTHFEFRHTFVSRNAANLIEQLKDFATSGQVADPLIEKEDAVKIAFVFPGQGAQWIGMGNALMAREPIFKATLEECNNAFKKYVQWDLFEEINKPLEQIDIVQPVLVAIEIALAKWWQSKGILPDVIVGHSMGEIAAAYIAGNISLDDAANVICNRSKLMKTRSGLGVMGVTELTFEEASEAIKGLEDKLSVAVTNSPTSTVLSGEEEALQSVFSKLEAEGKFCRMVKVDVASHSTQMDPILNDLRTAVANVAPMNGKITFYSTALNKEIEGSELDADYWVKNLRNPVRFGEAIRAIAADDKTIFIEMSPHPVLFNAVQENINAIHQQDAAKVFASFYREKDECLDLQANLGEVYATGLNIDWKQIYAPSKSFVILPNYQWQRERYWFDEVPSVGQTKRSTSNYNAGEHFYQYDWTPVKLQPVKENEEHILIVQGSGTLHESLSQGLYSNCEEVEITSVENIAVVLADSSFDKIIYISNPTEKQNLSEAIEGGCLKFQTVVKAILENSKNKTPQLITVTQNAFSIESEQLNLAGNLLTGIVRTLRNEHPELNAISIDIDEESIEKAVAIILQPQNDVKEYLIRANEVNTQVLSKIATNIPTANLTFDTNACFLITGGTSGLGLAMAEWLQKQGVHKLALISRSGAKTETQASIERIEAGGGVAKVYKADIANLSEVEKLIQIIETDLGKVTGVIHAAGLLADGTFTNLTKAQFETVAQPKVSGALNIHQALHTHSLTHFISFSSAASVLGSTGQSNYNGANFYLDQLMLWRAAKNLPSTVVNWGNIGGVGLAAAQENRGNRLSDIGLDTIEPNEFGAFFTLIVALGKTQVIPAKIDFDKWAAANPAVKTDSTFSKVLSGERVEIAEDSDENNPWGNSMAAATKKLKDMLKTHISSITKTPTARIKEEDTFKSMGIDSMMALQLKNKIQADTNLNIAVSSIWTHATIQKYVAFLIKELNIEALINTKSDSVSSNDAFTERKLKEILKQHISAITKIQAARIKETETFKSMGIDSMQALQLKNKLQADVGLNLAVSSIWTHPTIEKYAAFLAKELGIGAEKQEEIVVEETKKIATASEITNEVEDLSLEDLMKQLDDKSSEY